MEIKQGDYVEYKGKVYLSAPLIGEGPIILISYTDLEILHEIPIQWLRKLTDLEVSTLIDTGHLPKVKIKEGDRVKLRADLNSCGVYTFYTFIKKGFKDGSTYIVDISNNGIVIVNSSILHEFEVELV